MRLFCAFRSGRACVMESRGWESFLVCIALLLAFARSEEDACDAYQSIGCPEGHTRDASVMTNTSTRSTWARYAERITSSLAAYQPCDESGCGCYESVLADNLNEWRQKGGITLSDFQAAKQYAVHYQIIDHKLYRQGECIFELRCRGVEHFLLQLVRSLPDTEFLVNTRDYPLVQRYPGYRPLPVFSFSKTVDYGDILYPAWTFWAGGPSISIEPMGLGRWDLKRETITKAAQLWPWDKKKPIAFFRGSRTNGERDPLVMFSRSHPELVDAAYTKNQAWKSDKDTLGAPAANEVSLEDHCEYKYLFNFRGVAASFRFKHLFLCKSLVFHVGGNWAEFFYPLLQPWVHYIPVQQDMQQLEDLLEFVRTKDQIVEGIALRQRLSTYLESLKNESCSVLLGKIVD